MHRTNALLLSTLSLALIGGACTWSPEQNVNNVGSAGGAGRKTGPQGAGGTGVSVDGSIGPTDGANCGVMSITTTKQPADVLLVQDKSGSMDMDASGANCNTPGCSKWDQMTPALIQVVTQTQADVRWGLKFFSDPNGRNQCAVNNMVQVAPGQNNGMAITTAINGTMPGGATPTRLAVSAAATYLRGNADTNPKYILLATDGLPNCIPNNNNQQADDTTGAVQAIATALTMGIPTFVVGIGSTGATATLTMMAQAGGRPTAAAPFYYQVNSQADLVAALSMISGSVASCTFALNGTPPDPTNVKVQGDGVTIPPNDVNGWVYEPGDHAITLKGTYCDRVLSGDIKNVAVLFGCGIGNIP